MSDSGDGLGLTMYPETDVFDPEDEDYTPEERRLKRLPIVFQVVAQCRDPPFVEFISNRFRIMRGQLKRVVVVITLFHVILFKAIDMRVYAVWKISTVSIARSKASDVVIRNDDADAENAAEPEEDALGVDWNNVTLVGNDSEAQTALCNAFNRISNAAEQVCQVPEAMAHIEKAAAKLRKAADADGSGGDDDDDAAADGPEGEGHEKKRGTTRRGPRMTSQSKGGPTAETDPTLRANRALIAPLVDGDTVDYSVLTDAYADGQQQLILDELQAFVDESETSVQQVCREHYIRFLDAADRGAAIDPSKVNSLGSDLAKYATDVKMSGTAIAAKGKELLAADRTHSNLLAAEIALREARQVALLLERCEELVATSVLESAMSNIMALEAAARPIYHTKLGQYVLQRRSGELRAAVLRSSVSKLTAWLASVRDAAPTLGANAIKASSLLKRAMTPKKDRHVVMMPDGRRWTARETRGKLTEELVASAFLSRLDPQDAVLKAEKAAQSSLGATSVAEARSTLISPSTTTTSAAEYAVSNGSSIYPLFVSCGEVDMFTSALEENRRKQLDLLLEEVATVNSIDTLRIFAEKCLGFLVAESLLHFTPARLRTPLDVLAAWGPIESAIETAARSVPFEVNFEIDLENAKTLAKLLVSIADAAEVSVTAAHLSTNKLRDFAKFIRDRYHASALRSLSQTVSTVVGMDTLDGMRATSSNEFADTVSAFLLNQAPDLINIAPTFDVTSSGGHLLPFSACVPVVGHELLAFVASAYDMADVAASDNSADELMLDYVQVALRTTASMLRAKLMMGDVTVAQAAVASMNATAFTIVCSVVEQRLVVRWKGPLPATPQPLGQPVLLAEPAQDMRSVIDVACDSATKAIVGRINEILAPGYAAMYWRQRYKRMKNATGDPMETNVCALAVAHSRHDVQQLQAIWPTALMAAISATVVNHLAESVPGMITRAIKDVELKDCGILLNVIDQFDTEVVKETKDSLPQLAAELKRRCPVDLVELVKELRDWIGKREMEWAEEKQKRLLVEALADGVVGSMNTGARVVSGAVNTGTRVVTQTAANAAKATTEGVAAVGEAMTKGTKRWFGFGRTKATTPTAEPAAATRPYGASEPNASGDHLTVVSHIDPAPTSGQPTPRGTGQGAYLTEPSDNNKPFGSAPSSAATTPRAPGPARA